MLLKLLFGKAILNFLDRMARDEPESPPSAATQEISSPSVDNAPAPAAEPSPLAVAPLTFPRVQRRAMGSLFEVYLAGTERDLLVAAAEEALDQVQRMEDQLSHYRSDSDVARLNANASEHWVRLEPRLYAFIRHCLDLSQ